MANPTTLSNVAPTLLPPTLVGPIFAKTSELSAIQQLARKIPLSVNANTAIPVPMDVPVADWVAEGGIKAGGQVGVGVKIMTGKKLALLVPVSQEVVKTNPAGLYDQLAADLPTAMSRAFDYAAINGKSLKTGGAGPFSDYLAACTNTMALGTAAASAGGLYADLVTGAGKVVDRNFDFTGIAADPRLKLDAQLAVDTTGRPLLVDGSLAGFSAFYNKGVSGRYWRAGDSVQTITIGGSPTGGTFTVSSGGNTYTAAYNVATATLQAAIQAWGGIYATVTVTGTAGSSYVVTFPAITSNIAGAAAPIVVNGKALTGGTPTYSVAASGAGGADSLLRGIGGDWSQAAYGVGMDITVKLSDQASYFDGTSWHSAFQENLTLLLVEAYYGFVMGSPDAFVAYTKGSATF